MPGEPRTGRGRASRERIVERAADLFAERGIAGTSVDEVLAAAKAGKGQFYHYFRNRDELAAAAVGYRCAQVVDGLTDALGDVSSLAGLEQALAGFIAGFEQTGLPGCPIGTLAARGRRARRAGHGAAGQHRGRDGAQPGSQGRSLSAHRGGHRARAGTDPPELTLY